MSVTQNEKAIRFRALHDAPHAFIIPQSVDVASARILAGTWLRGAGHVECGVSAAALGRKDGELTRDEAMDHSPRLIVDATDLPVSADLERGLGDQPEVVAETIRLPAGAGLVGCTIEDSTRNPDAPLYDFELAVQTGRGSRRKPRVLCRFPLS